MPVSFPVKKEDDEDDSTAPYYEKEIFTSMWDALRWRHVRQRVPVCFRKTLRNRYMLANLIYLGYTIGLLIVDFHPDFSSPAAEVACTNETVVELAPLDQPVQMNEYANRIYIGRASRVSSLLSSYEDCAC